MPELRQNFITGEWVVVATERARRPDTFGRSKDEKIEQELPAHKDNCPFCEGNEQETPPEIIAYRPKGHADGPGWTVRVVPNKFPALEIGAEACPEGDELFTSMNGYGVHEVIVETTAHNKGIGRLPAEQVYSVITAYQERMEAMAGDPNLAYALIFRNHGLKAGASIEHPHSQLVALPFIPPSIDAEMAGARDYFIQTGECPYCAMLQAEKQAGERMVMENQDFAAFIPYASHLPFAAVIMPKKHSCTFSTITDGEKHSLAALLQGFLAALDERLDDPPYNYYIHTSPLGVSGMPDYHWHIQVVPKLTTVAGFEMGTGTYINVTRPEEAAVFLREGAEKWSCTPQLI